MKILRKILIGIATLVALVLVTAAFVQQDYTVEKTVVINKPKEQVFGYIAQLKNQDRYSTFTMKDPGMKKQFRGTDAAVGFVYAWDGNADAGKGEQEIIALKPGERIDLALRFEKPMEGEAAAYMTTRAIADNQTLVSWGFSSKVPYPFNFVCLFMDMEKMMGKELSQSLLNMKKDLEQ